MLCAALSNSSKTVWSMILQVNIASSKNRILPLVILMLVEMFFSSRIFLKLH